MVLNVIQEPWIPPGIWLKQLSQHRYYMGRCLHHLQLLNISLRTTPCTIYCNSISARWWRVTARRDSLSKNGHNSHIGWSSATCSLNWKWQSTQITLVLIGAMQAHSGLEDSSNQTKWLKEKVVTSTLSAFKQARQTPFHTFRGNIVIFPVCP